MSDLQVLGLVLVVVYGWECACWLPRGSVAFRTWLGRPRAGDEKKKSGKGATPLLRWSEPGKLLGNERGGFVFASPLPPLGWLLAATPFPVSVSAEAVLGYGAPSLAQGTFTFGATVIRFDEIRAMECRGKKVLINGQLVVKNSSASTAARLAEQLRSLSKLPAAKRPAAIAGLANESLDTKLIEERWKEFHKAAKPVRLLANLLFLCLFGLAPLMIWHFSLSAIWLGLLLGLLALTTATALLFRRVHHRFYPQAEEDRFNQSLLVLLAPVTTLRAHDLLSRPLLELFHPLAVAKVFCPQQQFRALAAAVWRNLRYAGAGPAQVAPAARQTQDFARMVWQKAIEDFLQKNGISLDELARAPVRTDASSRFYCPRCLAQYTTNQSFCADCGGVALVPFPNQVSPWLASSVE